MRYVRPRGRCRLCGRVVLLTRTGTLFLHGDTPTTWNKDGTYTTGDHCPGGMTVEFDPSDTAVVPLSTREARP